MNTLFRGFTHNENITDMAFGNAHPSARCAGAHSGTSRV